MADASKFFNPSSNYNRLFNNPKFIGDLLDNIRSKLGRILMTPEKQYIVSYLKSVDPRILNKPPNIVMQILEKEILEKLTKMNCVEDEVNIHDLLKQEIGASNEDVNVSADTLSNQQSFTTQVTNNFANAVDIASILGTKSLDAFKSMFSAGGGVKTAYLLLDTRYRVLDNDGRNQFKWNFSSTSNTIQGSVNAIGDIENITAMRVAPFKMPYNTQGDNDYDRITMNIQEFSAQSFIAQENRRFHFMFPTFVSDRYINMVLPRDIDGEYKFTQPITRLDSITIDFASPLDPLIFDTDRRNMLLTSYGTITTFMAADNHNLETGDLVYITNFTTANPNLDTPIISAINNVNGVVATFINATSISIEVSTVNLRYTGVGTISVTNGSAVITGAGTTFISMFSFNDFISILGVKYRITVITSDTSITISTVYAGTTGAGLAYLKDNTLPAMNPSFYFGSKRMFIPMQFDYIKKLL